MGWVGHQQDVRSGVKMTKPLLVWIKNSAKLLEALVHRLCNVPGCW